MTEKGLNILYFGTEGVFFYSWYVDLELQGVKFHYWISLLFTKEN
jgi:hypothetical protein